MRALKTLLSSATTFLLLAVAAPALTAQDPVKVEITTKHDVWYLDPVWLGIGGVVALLIIVLAIMASRGRDSGTRTTVVR